MNFDVIKLDEVRVMYDQAANKRQQIKIMADLMNCEEADVCDLLGIAHTKKRKHGNIVEEKAFEMYRDGATTEEIAKEFGVTESAVKAWKWRSGLMELSEEIKKNREQFQMFYDQGMNDMEIAKATGTNRKTVCDWRKQNRLPAHALARRRIWEECEEKFFALYEKGMTDTQIAEACDVNPWNVRDWRHHNELKSNRCANGSYCGRKKKDWDEENRRCRPLYDQGLNDQQIANLIFSNKRTVCEWRHKFKLPVNGRK